MTTQTLISALTGLEMVEQAAKLFDIPPKFSAVGDFMITVLGILIPIVRELKEISY